MSSESRGDVPGGMGKKVATVGAVMFAASVVLGLLGVGGATLNNFLGLGGIVVGVVGIVLWRIVKV